MPELAERVVPILRHVLRTGETVPGVELALRGPEDAPHAAGRFLATYFPTRAEDGGVSGVGSILLDITAHAELQDRLRQAQKMEAIGQLAGGVAHDFNNLLAAILMNCEFLAEALPAESEGHRELDDLCTAARQAANLTRQLLTFSRKQVLAPTVLDLNRSVREVEGLLRRLLGPGIAVEVTLSDVPVHVRADPSQMTQVLMNLAVNARDAMPDLGVLRIRTGAVSADEAAAAAPREQPDSEYVVLEVEDTGAGMSAEVRRHLFEPFFSTKEPGRGTGLGLATVHYIVVEQAGGFIRVDSAPGAGTRFRLYFPRERAEAPVADRRAARLHDLPRGDETVLVVDDEPEVRHSVRRLLERLGYTVLAAENGAAALALLGAEPERGLGLLLTDVVMPEMGGRELAHQVRRRCPSAGVLFMSGYTQEAIRIDDFPGAAVGFIEKPFTLDAMARQVRAMLDGAGPTTFPPDPSTGRPDDPEPRLRRHQPDEPSHTARLRPP
jgi:signal transduction histidine kinase/DNA-binding NarL/FixJ family response regulator